MAPISRGRWVKKQNSARSRGSRDRYFFPVFLAGAFLAAFFTAFLVAYFIVDSPERNLRSRRSQCDSYIRCFGIKVKRKILRCQSVHATLRQTPTQHPSNHFLFQMFLAIKALRRPIFTCPQATGGGTISADARARLAVYNGSDFACRAELRLRPEEALVFLPQTHTYCHH